MSTGRARGRRRGARLVAAVTTVAAALLATTPRASFGAGVVPLAAEGGSFLSPLMNKLQNETDALSAIAPFVPTYFDADVDQARQDFADGSADYAVSEFPLTAAQAASAASKGRAFAYVPFAATPVALAAVVECGQQDTVSSATWCTPGSIEVTQKLLVQMFTDLPDYVAAGTPGALPGVQTWNDPAMLALTPGLAGASNQSHNMFPLEDAQPSVTNYALEALFASSPDLKPTWDSYLQFYANTSDDTPSDTWPAVTLGVTPNASAIAQKLIPDVPQSNPPVPSSDPTHWGQGEVAALAPDWLVPPRSVPALAVQNAAGAFVTPTVAAMTAALGHATIDSTTNLVTFSADSTDAASYPLPVMSYLIVPTTGLALDKATALANFVRFLLGSQGQQDLTTMGSAPVTAAMAAAGLKVADEVAAQGTSPTTTTTGTTSTTTASTTSTTTAALRTGPGTGSSGGGTPSTDSGGSPSSQPTLASTGGVPWPLLIIGGFMALAGYVARRALWWRTAPRRS